MPHTRTQTIGYLALFCGMFLVVAGLFWLTHHKNKIPRSLDLPPDVSAEMARQGDGSDLTPQLAINVYIDGSGSIEHFLHLPEGRQKSRAGSAANTEAGANYLRVLLDRIAPTMGTEPAWHGHQIRFWRFGGDSPVHLPDSDVATMSNHPDRSQFPEMTTKIEVPFAIGAPPASLEEGQLKSMPELKIVITDLYESSLKMGQLGQQIAQRYLGTQSPQQGAVSIIAVRNPFFGTVEDLPGQEAGRPTASSMPFYVIMAGPVNDVRFATKMLLDRAGLRDAFADGNAKLFFFMPQNGRPLPGVPESTGTTKKFHLMRDDYQHSGISFFSLKDGTLKLHWPEELPDTWLNEGEKDNSRWQSSWSITPLALDHLKFSALIYGSDKNDPNKPSDNPDAAESASQCSGEGVCTEVDGTHLLNGKDYCFRVDLVEKPSENFRARSEALEPWSIEMQDAQKLSIGGKSGVESHFPHVAGLSDPSPGRTPDLSLFLTALQGEISPALPGPAANHYYFFIHAD